MLNTLTIKELHKGRATCNICSCRECPINNTKKGFCELRELNGKTPCNWTDAEIIEIRRTELEKEFDLFGSKKLQEKIIDSIMLTELRELEPSDNIEQLKENLLNTLTIEELNEIGNACGSSTNCPVCKIESRKHKYDCKYYRILYRFPCYWSKADILSISRMERIVDKFNEPNINTFDVQSFVQNYDILQEKLKHRDEEIKKLTAEIELTIDSKYMESVIETLNDKLNNELNNNECQNAQIKKLTDKLIKEIDHNKQLAASNNELTLKYLELEEKLASSFTEHRRFILQSERDNLMDHNREQHKNIRQLQADKDVKDNTIVMQGAKIRQLRDDNEAKDSTINEQGKRIQELTDENKKITAELVEYAQYFEEKIVLENLQKNIFAAIQKGE